MCLHAHTLTPSCRGYVVGAPRSGTCTYQVGFARVSPKPPTIHQTLYTPNDLLYHSQYLPSSSTQLPPLQCPGGQLHLHGGSPELDNCRAPAGARPPPPELALITTPLRAEEWEFRLHAHPDRAFRSYILQGIREGFCLGFDRSSRCHPATRNLRSAYEHPEIIDAYLDKEAGLGWAIRFTKLAASSLPELTISPIGVIPKRNRSNKWRLIVDFSSPKGRSVNDGISSTLCSLTYASIDDAVGILRILGEGALMAKLALRDAYQVVPVYPHDCPLLGMQWREGIVIDATLPFGLCSAPKVFSAVADGLMWMVHHQGFTHSLHYLDDFMLLGPPGSHYCEEAQRTTVQLCDDWGYRWQAKNPRARRLLPGSAPPTSGETKGYHAPSQSLDVAPN